MEFRKYMRNAEFEKALHSLIGIIDGITSDQQINNIEIEELQNWCLLQRIHQKRYPFKDIIPMIKDSLEDGILTSDEVENIQWVCETYLNENPYFDVITTDIQQLHGLLHGIMSDNVINERELRYLKSWLEGNSHLQTIYPYDEVYSLVFNVLQDGKIDLDEEMMLKALFVDFIDTKASYNINKSEYDELKKTLNINGLCAIAPSIELTNRAFCFTGESSRMKRSELANIIEENGGIFHKDVKKDTNFLIVGDNGNPCWAFSCYGRKVEKAMNLRKQGKNILIVHEVDFWNVL